MGLPAQPKAKDAISGQVRSWVDCYFVCMVSGKTQDNAHHQDALIAVTRKPWSIVEVWIDGCTAGALRACVLFRTAACLKSEYRFHLISTSKSRYGMIHQDCLNISFLLLFPEHEVRVGLAGRHADGSGRIASEEI